MFRNSRFYLLSLVLLTGAVHVSAADLGFGGFGAYGGGAHIGGDNQMDVRVKNAIALGINTESKIMIGHVADNVSIGGNNTMRIRTGNVFSLGFSFWGIEKKACISIATIGGHC